jgi:hypothetical protein
MASTVNLPVSLAVRKGVSALAELSGDKRVALTSHGRVVAVVDSPDRVDAEVREVSEAAWAVVEAAADLAGGSPSWGQGPVEPGSTHDITAAHTHTLGANLACPSPGS